jgi:hypothetical protein
VFFAAWRSGVRLIISGENLAAQVILACVVTLGLAPSVSNQLSTYGAVQTGTHPASRGPGRRSIRTQGRPPGLLHTKEVTEPRFLAVNIGKEEDHLHGQAIAVPTPTAPLGRSRET